MTRNDARFTLDESNFTNAGTEYAREVKNVIDFIDKLKILHFMYAFFSQSEILSMLTFFSFPKKFLKFQVKYVKLL